MGITAQKRCFQRSSIYQNAGITVGGAIADNGTTGRQSTGEKVNVYLEEYVNGEYGRTSYIGQPTEGQLIDLSGSTKHLLGQGQMCARKRNRLLHMRDLPER